MDCEEVLSSLAAAGYASLTLQIGQGAYVPTRVGDVEVQLPGDSREPGERGEGDSEESNEEAEEGARAKGKGGKGVAKGRRATKKRRRSGKTARIRVEYFRLVPSLAAYMDASSLIISHAGAGSLFEGLNAGRRVIAVPNPDLMVNHQQELAKHLADSGFLLHADLTSIPRAVAAMDTAPLKKYKPGNPAKIIGAIDAMF